MRKEFVEKLKWIDEKEMMDMVAIAQSSPGAVSYTHLDVYKRQSQEWLTILHEAAGEANVEPKLLIDMKGPELRIGKLDKPIQMCIRDRSRCIIWLVKSLKG